MPDMYNMMYGNSTPDTQQGYGSSFQRAMNNPMTRYGMQMMQGQNPFAQAPTPTVLAAPTAPAMPRGGPRRRIRIGNKTYEEVDDSPQQQMQQAAPSAPAAQY